MQQTTYTDSHFCFVSPHCPSCIGDNENDQMADQNPHKRGAQDAKISPDGKWKSFPQVPCLLQYVPTGIFYGRKVRKKINKDKLETAVFTTAELKLND